MPNETQQYKPIPKSDLLATAQNMRADSWRLAQISATRKETLDLLYSFIKQDDMVNYRVEIARDEPIESVSGIYPYAFIYENELHDLFGVQVQNINLDFGGNFYKIRTPDDMKDDPDPKEETAKEDTANG